MSETMTRRKVKQQLDLNPHGINEFSWWYEEEAGITVVQEARRDDGTYLRTVQTRIPWRFLLAAAKRAGRE